MNLFKKIWYYLAVKKYDYFTLTVYVAILTVVAYAIWIIITLNKDECLELVK